MKYVVRTCVELVGVHMSRVYRKGGDEIVKWPQYYNNIMAVQYMLLWYGTCKVVVYIVDAVSVLNVHISKVFLLLATARFPNTKE